MDDEKNFNIDSESSEMPIENLDEEFADEVEEGVEEGEEVIDNDYDNNFYHGPNSGYSDQNVINKLREIRDNAHRNINNSRSSNDGDEKKKKKKNSLDDKDGLDDKDKSLDKDGKDKKGKDKKDGSSSNAGNSAAEEGAKNAASEAGKSAAKEAGKEAASEAGKTAAKEAGKSAAKEAAGSSVGIFGLKFLIIKWLIIGSLILLGVLMIVAFFMFAYENLIGSITTFFGISEKTTDVEYDEKTYEQDGLLTDYKYQYVKSTCNLDNYKESDCICSPDESGCTSLSHEDLIKVLKSDDKCKIDSSWYQFWDKISLFFSGGTFNDECQLLRFVRGAIQSREDAYKKYNLKLDKGLVVGTIISSYDKQEKDIYSSDTTLSTPTVDSVNHYEVLKDIASEGIIKTDDINKLIQNTLLEEVYPYYTYEDGTCTLKSKINYKFSLDKWKIFMRYGGAYNNSILGISDKDYSVAGYLAVDNSVILDKDSAYEPSSPSSLLNLSGTGWVYDLALNNAWNQSSEECREESFFTDRKMKKAPDISTYMQAVKDITSLEKDVFDNANVTYRDGSTNKEATIKFDYRAGFMYNKFTIFKKAIDEGNQRYDETLSPKRMEQFLEEILDRKAQINEILFFENDNSETLITPVSSVETSKYYWPIGSDTTTTINGVEFATDDPAYTKITSNYGMRTHPVSGTYKMHKGVDIAGKEGVTNVIAAKGGTVVQVNNSCSPGNKSCGSGYGNYIKIAHSDGNYTLYAHLHKNSIRVQVNDEVSQGQVIAKVGNTGNSTGPHLHFEVRTSSVTRVNPLNYIDPENPRPQSSGDIGLTSGSSNKGTVCLSLLGSGISENATIALMINIQAESGFDPENTYLESDGDYSYGLFQWKGQEQKDELISFAAERGLDYKGIEAQLNFVFYKMLHGGNRAKQAYDSLMNTSNSAQTMATDFCILYERPANKETNCPKRAEKHYDKISTFVKNGCKD